MRQCPVQLRTVLKTVFNMLLDCFCANTGPTPSFFVAIDPLPVFCMLFLLGSKYDGFPVNRAYGIAQKTVQAGFLVFNSQRLQQKEENDFSFRHTLAENKILYILKTYFEVREPTLNIVHYDCKV